VSPEVKIKRFCLERRPSPIGTLLLVTDDDGALRALDFGDYEPRMHRLLRQHYKVYSLEDGPAPVTVAKALTDYFEGDMSAIKDISVITGGTAFQREVWEGLRGITAGATKSYGQLAAQLGHPGASRAVGLANGANPVGIVVPCHRVIGANGALTGYGGGLMRKRWLLDHERRHSGAELQQHLLLRDR
jgi:methylated-DNA-[protein]-cysteine S-methyltransferase